MQEADIRSSFDESLESGKLTTTSSSAQCTSIFANHQLLVDISSGPDYGGNAFLISAVNGGLQGTPNHAKGEGRMNICSLVEERLDTAGLTHAGSGYEGTAKSPCLNLVVYLSSGLDQVENALHISSRRRRREAATVDPSCNWP